MLAGGMGTAWMQPPLFFLDGDTTKAVILSSLHWFDTNDFSGNSTVGHYHTRRLASNTNLECDLMKSLEVDLSKEEAAWVSIMPVEGTRNTISSLDMPTGLQGFNVFLE